MNIENLALSGGGLKGIAYVGCFKAFEKYGIKSVCYRPFSGYGEDQDINYPFPNLCKNLIMAEKKKMLKFGEMANKSEILFILMIVLKE